MPLTPFWLQTLCDEAKKDQKLTEAADIGDYIRAYLNTNYQYNASAPQPPEGADPIRYFLTGSKQGYSVQFASAAVVMFRMFGLPARYVVGYAAPQSLFTQQDGSWHAILQDDNAHAWAEVYISGQGWTPMEMTPGVLVSAQQADLRTDPLPETQGQDTAPAAGESSASEPAATIVPRSRLVLAASTAFWCAAACRRIHHPMRRSLPHFCKVVSPPLNPRMPKLCWHWPKPPNLAQVR